MFRAVLIEEGVECTAQTIAELAKKIYEYISECYGFSYILDADNKQIEYKQLKNTGEYFIHTPSRDVQCIIDFIR